MITITNTAPTIITTNFQNPPPKCSILSHHGSPTNPRSQLGDGRPQVMMTIVMILMINMIMIMMVITMMMTIITTLMDCDDD